MKRVITCCLPLAVFAMAGCSPRVTPSQTSGKFLDAMVNSDFASASELSDGVNPEYELDRILTSQGDMFGTEQDNILHLVLGQVTYELGTTSYDGESARVAVEISAPDCQIVSKTALQYVLPMQSVSPTWNTTSRYTHYFETEVAESAAPRVVSNVTITLKKKEGTWAVQLRNDNALLNALTGGMSNVLGLSPAMEPSAGVGTGSVSLYLVSACASGRRAERASLTCPTCGRSAEIRRRKTMSRTGRFVVSVVLSICVVTGWLLVPDVRADPSGVWTQYSLEDSGVWALAVDPATSTRVYAGTKSDGVLRSDDSGKHWHLVTSGLNNSGVTCLALDPSDPSTLFAGTQSRLYRSTNRGDYWHRLALDIAAESVDPLLSNALHIKDIAIDPEDSRTAYAGTLAGCFRSTDAGDTWQAIGPTVQYDSFDGDFAVDVLDIAIDPADPSQLYVAAATSRAFLSTDGGDSWHSAGLEDSIVQCMSIDPLASNTLYAGTEYDGVLVSHDGAGSWVPTGLAKGTVNCLAIDSHKPSILYAGTDSGVLRSTDSGVHWQSVPDKNEFCLALALDPQNPSIVYGGGFGVFRGAFASSKVVQLTIGKYTMTVAGKVTKLEAAPIIRNSRTYLSLRAIAEATGSVVSWDEKAWKATVTRNGTKVELWISGNIARVDGKSVKIDAESSGVTPIIINGRTMVPLRFIAETLELSVQWNATTRVVTLTCAP